MTKNVCALALPILYWLFTGSASALIKCPANGDPATIPPGCEVGTPGCKEVPCASPIIVDTDGKGFHLTSAEDGVLFDISGSGRPLQMAWTAAGSTNAFLALPHNGAILSGKDLFGNFTPQHASDHPNGFIALAEYDKPEHGGNGDGIIDQTDEIFFSLRLWIDKNHDGVAQPVEMFTLPELGVFSISLRYREARREDSYGNLFRYKGRVNLIDPNEPDSKAGPLAYDVFFEAVSSH